MPKIRTILYVVLAFVLVLSTNMCWAGKDYLPRDSIRLSNFKHVDNDKYDDAQASGTLIYNYNKIPKALKLDLSLLINEDFGATHEIQVINCLNNDREEYQEHFSPEETDEWVEKNCCVKKNCGK